MDMSSRVFVGGLTYRVRERDLEKFFRKYGRIKEIAIKNGFAFVEFDDYRDAEDAVYELNGRELLGERVSVERARGTPRGSDRWRGGGGGGGGGRSYDPPPRMRSRERMDSRYGPPTRTEYRVIVENLSSRVSWQDLKDYMRQAGEVTYADAHKRKNEGLVEFATYSDMKKAIDKLDNTEINGRRIRVIEDKFSGGRRSRSSDSRSRSRSRSHRRSRSRSRSGSRRSRSKSRDRSKSKSRSRSRPRSESKRSKSRSVSKAKEESNDRSHSRSRSGSRDHSKSRSRSRSRSHSADNAEADRNGD
ncbi:serine-arginine protein 55 isoform X2 [Chrysoperla carnea]|uniref:serine-arginine protein 55 isoform X2 n=1 Tax=Chrysoperla carnea TaxID=189513 RepID=UPI001D097EC7|nr:serine-arginine protein 55 isoform X2 [Chrysoperla carnea]